MLLLCGNSMLCSAQNPIISSQFTADPTARVFNDRVYLFPSHDILPPEDVARKDWFCMADYHVFSSDNLVDWTDHGVIVDQKNVPWGNPKGYSMWAPDCVEKNGTYYFYFPDAPRQGMGFGVGVAFSNKPEGPYRPMFRPIEGIRGIDPCVLIDDDGKSYIYYGAGKLYVAQLKDNMMELETEPKLCEGLPTKGLIEGPFAFKHQGKYYLTFPWARTNIEVLAYAISDNPMGPFEMKGLIMEESPTGCWTNHHSIVNYHNQWYLFYHHNDYSPNMDKHRSVRIDSLSFNPDGTIQMVKPTLRGVGITPAKSQIQIDRYSEISNGASIDFLQSDSTRRWEGWKTIFNQKGATVRYNSVDFGNDGVETIKMKVRSVGGGTLTVGTPKEIASVKIPSCNDWRVVSAKLKSIPNGKNDLFVTLQSGKNVEVDWVAFDNPPLSKGAFETHQYRNYFLEMGYSQKQIDDKLKEVFNDVFYGKNKVYFEVGDSLGYISDIKNNDARTEGMSYGMMLAVQFNKKDIFDRLWRWSKKYMQMEDGPNKGYFAWSCQTDGKRNAQGAASDGELYFITSLIFASNLWGNDTGIDYLAEAQYILDQSFAKVGKDVSGPLIDLESKLITFTPGNTYTDPSYHIPAFYEVWAKWADDGRSGFWKECAKKSREYLHKSINPKTGLNPDFNNYDGTLRGGRGFMGGGNNFRYDSWRVPMNIALDYSWSCADKEWQQNYGNTIQNFLYSKGVDKFVDQYTVDGEIPTDTLRAGNFPKALRHSMGLVATSAAVSLVCTHAKSNEFVKQLWNTPHAPLADGYFDAYYDGILRLFAFMHLSGNYRVIEPRINK